MLLTGLALCSVALFLKLAYDFGGLSTPARGTRNTTVQIAAVGDIMLDRGVWRRIEEHGPCHVMREFAEQLRAADITFANLECPLSTAGEHASEPGDVLFCADPGTVDVLADAGIDVVSLANNHALDAGRRGLRDTMSILRAHGIAYAGARPHRHAPDEITYVTVDDTVVAFLAYTDLGGAHSSPCEVDRDMRNVLYRVRQAREKADVVCVGYHWGVEYRKAPTQRQRDLGHATVDAGADIVIGHHPHVLGGVEAYNGGLILYSLGNFVFDQRDAPDGRVDSGIFELTVTVGQSIALTVSPVFVDPYECAPRLPADDRARGVLRGLQRLSASLGTDLRVDGSTARVVVSKAPPPTRARP